VVELLMVTVLVLGRKILRLAMMITEISKESCFKCKYDGHMVKNCPLNKPNTGRRESSNMAKLEGALISSTTNRSDEWFFDSAETKHTCMTNNRSMLENFVEYQQPKNIYLGDNTVIHALGEGKVRLPTVNSSHDVVLDLHKVLFVPKLTKNLPAMALMGAEIRFDEDKCLILKDSIRNLSLVIYCLTSSTQSIPSCMLKFQKLTVRDHVKFGTVD